MSTLLLIVCSVVPHASHIDLMSCPILPLSVSNLSSFCPCNASSLLSFCQNFVSHHTASPHTATTQLLFLPYSLADLHHSAPVLPSYFSILLSLYVSSCSLVLPLKHLMIADSQQNRGGIGQIDNEREMWAILSTADGRHKTDVRSLGVKTETLF